MDVDVFTARELRNNTGQLLKDAEKGNLSIITRHGVPMILAVPFDKQLLTLGVNKSVALHLLEKQVVTMAQAAKIAGLSIEEFLELLKETEIEVVDHSPDEIESDLENIL